MGAFIVVLRESFEACLVLGIVLGTLHRTSGARPSDVNALWLGTAAAVAVSIIAGAILFAAGSGLDGDAAKAYEAIAMLLAAAVLTWMLFWMRRQAATIGSELRARVASAVAAGGTLALASVAFVAVAREGVETALFLFASVGDDGVLETVLGGALGLVVAIGLGVAFYRGSARLDLKQFFRLTGILVILAAAYVLSAGIHELAELGGGAALEIAGPIAALLYALGLGWIYLKRPPRQASRPLPQQVA